MKRKKQTDESQDNITQQVLAKPKKENQLSSFMPQKLECIFLQIKDRL